MFEKARCGRRQMREVSALKDTRIQRPEAGLPCGIVERITSQEAIASCARQITTPVAEAAAGAPWKKDLG
jgi:hypothetical protein